MTPFADAFFTAVSTICVTGLATVDMATHWSPFGQVLVFLGVQIGALGVLTLASILGLVISRRLGLRAKLIAASDTNPLRTHGGPVNESQTVQLGQIGGCLRTVALSTLLIEGVLAVAAVPRAHHRRSGLARGAVGGALLRRHGVHEHRLHAQPRGSHPFAHDYYFLTVLMAGVFLGSHRLPGDLRPATAPVARAPVVAARRSSPSSRRSCCSSPAGRRSSSSSTTTSLTLGTQDAWDTTFQAFFLSAMTRSGGFAILDIGELNGSSLLVGCMLMFVGGGSASTAGGIKVTTLAVIALAVWSEAKGRQSNQVFGRRIPSDVLRVALSVVAWGSTIVALSTIIITQITKAELDRVLFDVISGFATVGLSTGLTAELPDPAIYVMAVTIIMGRVGTVTLAAAVAASSRSQLYSLPVERPIVG